MILFFRIGEFKSQPFFAVGTVHGIVLILTLKTEQYITCLSFVNQFRLSHYVPIYQILNLTPSTFLCLSDTLWTIDSDSSTGLSPALSHVCVSGLLAVGSDMLICLP